jgi:DNA-directed RNA polymerase beta subunit
MAASIYDCTWKLVESYFNENKGQQLVKHLIDSYNDFVLRKIDNILEGFNPIEIHHQYMPENNSFKYTLSIEVKNPTLAKPMIYEKDGCTKIMTPTDARNRNVTYAAPLTVDLIIKTKTFESTTNEYIEEDKRINNVNLGKIPIMVNSRYCVLSTCSNLIQDDECRYDYGGYFIINGNEKVIISQDRIAENKTYVFLNNKVSTYSHVAEIRSVTENRFSVPKTTSIKLSSKANQFGRYIRGVVHHIKHDIPIFVLFRALGIESDQKIISYIVRPNDPNYESIAQELTGSIEEANAITTTREAREYMLKFMNVNGHPKELMVSKDYRFGVLVGVLEKEFLPHSGMDLDKKAIYLGFMVNKLLSCYMGIMPFDDRDSYINKRVDTPGILLANLMRQYYGKVVKDMRNMVQKDINGGSWKATNKFINVITKVNVAKIVKSTIIEAGLKYGLATGNWGIKTSKTKQGVAQVLNRMTYSATISHLRRINTPIEKTGKLVQPRKLHATQWGIICPSETPEGVSVGLVKNLAVMSNITISSNSCYLRELLNGTNIIPYRKSDPSFLDEGSKVFVNGDLIGVAPEPSKLIRLVRSWKRAGIINTQSGIFWNIIRNEIWISTDGGRCTRPLYVVEQCNQQALRPEIIDNILCGKVKWNDLIINGIIEYLDVEECNNAIIAIKSGDLLKGFKGSTYPITYTHMEIDPSLILGVLAGSIPFSNHNQAPRNTYQCLWKEEPVLLANGEWKKIEHIDVGDEVVTFNPENMYPSITKVINQYVRPTDKVIYKLTTITGREITVTDDHKFMTNKGWMKAYDIDCNISVGIQITQSYTSNVKMTTSTRDIIQARVAGYMQSGKCKVLTENCPVPYIHINFESFFDAQQFENDVVYLGFKKASIQSETYYVNSNPSKTWFTRHDNDLMEWYIGYNVSFENKAILYEYLAAYITGYGATPLFGKVTLPETLDLDVIKQVFGKSEFVVDIEDYANKLGYRYSVANSTSAALLTEYKRLLPRYSMTYTEFYNSVELIGMTMFIPVAHKQISENVMIADITVASSNHSFIGGQGFCVHNSAMGKQAVGIYTSNFRRRFDTMGHILNYPQAPLVQTKVSKLINGDKLPCGMNVIVAIATWTGYNQEDSIIMNKSAVDRGMFVSTYYRTYKDQNTKNHSTGEEEFYCKPDEENTKGIKPYNYSKLAEDGFIPENTHVEAGDVIIGKCMPQKNGQSIVNKDASIALKNNEVGFIDKNCYNDNLFTNINGDGYTFAKVRVRSDRIPQIGDKASSRMGQKGTIGMLYNQCDMPFSQSGISPDIIINPHAIPSRMTIGQLMECLMGKACAALGTMGDGTPFTELSMEEISKVLDRCGIERYGNEVLYNSRTGEQMACDIFMGPTYYQRLKHMTCDKIHCSDPSHDVLTTRGWIPIPQVTKEDKVATLQDGELVYEHPIDVLHFPNYKGKMYRIKNQNIDLNVTANHRMYVSFQKQHNYKQYWTPYSLVPAEQIMGKHVKYQKNAEWAAPDYQFILESVYHKHGRGEAKALDMDSWLTFFGIWITEGWANKQHRRREDNVVQICQCKPRIRAVVFDALKKMGYNYTTRANKITVVNKQLYTYLRPLSVGAPNKSLPSWVWELSTNQARKLIHAMCLGDGTWSKNGCQIYYTSSKILANDFMRLCLHAGWSSNETVHIPKGQNTYIQGRAIVNKHDIFRLSVVKHKNNPSVNHGHQEVQEEEIYDYEGSVYCLQVPGEVFYVRRNGKPVWTGNSRAANGPVVLLTRQPAEGRARDGGLRLGEMEVECCWSHGSMQFLKERTMDNSDNYRTFICKKCGQMANVNPAKNVYSCVKCNNNTHFAEIRIPYASKLLFQEVQTMSIATKFIV